MNTSINQFLGKVEDTLTAIAAIPVLGTPFAVTKVGLGIGEVATGIFYKIKAAVKSKEENTKCLEHAAEYAKHGGMNMVAGLCESVPFVGLAMYQWRLSKFKDDGIEVKINPAGGFTHEIKVYKNSSFRKLYKGENAVTVKTNDELNDKKNEIHKVLEDKLKENKDILKKLDKNTKNEYKNNLIKHTVYQYMHDNFDIIHPKEFYIEHDDQQYIQESTAKKAKVQEQLNKVAEKINQMKVSRPS